MKLMGNNLSFQHPERERFIRANKLGADYEREGLEHVFARQIEREQEHERAISRNKGTQRTDEKLYQSSHERGNGERSHNTQSIKSDSRKIGQRNKQHAINFELERQHNKRKEITKQKDKKQNQKSQEREKVERRQDTQSIESDIRKIGQSHEQHAINFEHARQDVRRKRREFASDFDKWTRGNGKEQQQD